MGFIVLLEQKRTRNIRFFVNVKLVSFESGLLNALRASQWKCTEVTWSLFFLSKIVIVQLLYKHDTWVTQHARAVVKYKTSPIPGLAEIESRLSV